MPYASWIYKHEPGFKWIWLNSKILMCHIATSVFYPFSFPKFQTCRLRDEFLELWGGERGVGAGGQGIEGCDLAGIDLALADWNGWSASFFNLCHKIRSTYNI